MRIFLVLAALGAGLLAGCEPEPQPPGLLVATAPPGASCLLTRQGRTVGAVGPTPAIAHGVDGGTGVVTIACRRPGFAETTVNVPPTAAAPGYPDRVDIALAPIAPGPPPLLLH